MAKLPRNPLRKLTPSEQKRLVIADEYLEQHPPDDRGYREVEKIAKRLMYGACNRTAIARKIREVRALPVAPHLKPLRDHYLRLAIADAKGTQPYQCRRAGRMVASARKLALRSPK